MHKNIQVFDKENYKVRSIMSSTRNRTTNSKGDLISSKQHNEKQYNEKLYKYTA